MSHVIIFAQARTIHELDERLTRVLYGYDTIEQYYDAQSSRHVIQQVETPMLFINAKDDPFYG